MLKSSIYNFAILILQICKHSNLLKSIGLEVKPFRLHWYTTWFNRIIQKWGSTRPKLLLAWFSTGSLVAITLVPLAVGLLFRSMYLNLRELINEEYTLTTIGTFQPMVIFFLVVWLCFLFTVSIDRNCHFNVIRSVIFCFAFYLLL